jgi:hypothetical protein
MRRHLSWVLCTWLVLQLAGVLSPVVLAATSVVGSEELCTCPDTEPGATCPMHHDSTTNHQDDSTCRIQNTRSGPAISLLSLESGMGLLPSTATLSFVLTVGSVDSMPATPLTRTDLPDAPPPRS